MNLFSRSLKCLPRLRGGIGDHVLEFGAFMSVSFHLQTVNRIVLEVMQGTLEVREMSYAEDLLSASANVVHVNLSSSLKTSVISVVTLLPTTNYETYKEYNTDRFEYKLQLGDPIMVKYIKACNLLTLNTLHTSLFCDRFRRTME